jgi:hypothetical protein
MRGMRAALGTGKDPGVRTSGVPPELVCAVAQSARGKTIRLGRLSDEEDLNGPLAPGQAGSGRAWNGTSRAGTSSG